MRLHRLLGKEEPLADLSIDETVCDELEHLDLASRRILSDFASRGRRERNDRAAAGRAATCGSCLEPAAVIPIPVEDLLALSGVHEFRIGVAVTPL